MQPAKTIAAGLLALTLAGCAGDSPNTGAGVTLGALTGGLFGAAVGRGPGAVVAGAVIGGLVGGAIGSSLDEADRRRAYEAEETDALGNGGPGAPMSWRGTTGYGTVVPGPTYVYGAYPRCREYTHTIYIDGRPVSERGVACRNPDGTWAPLPGFKPYAWGPPAPTLGPQGR
jgi:surface antigen